MVDLLELKKGTGRESILNQLRDFGDLTSDYGSIKEQFESFRVVLNRLQPPLYEPSLMAFTPAILL